MISSHLHSNFSLSRFRALVCLLFLTSIAVLGQDLREFSGKKIVSISPPKLDGVESTKVAKSLGIEVGARLDLGRLNQGMRAALGSSSWRQLGIEAAARGQGVAIQLYGIPARKIRKVEFEGIPEEILSEFRETSLKGVHQAPDSPALQKLVQGLRRVYLERGFAAVEVMTEFRPVPDSQMSDLVIRVDAGESVRVRNVRVEGASPEENNEMASLIPLDRGEVFSAPKVEEGIAQILKYLRANQYPTSKVVGSEVKIVEGGREADLIVRVRIEQKVIFRFVNHSVFSHVQLRALLTEDVLSLADPTPRIVALVEQKYRGVGYAFATVTPVVVQEAEPTENSIRMVELRIDEGERVMIDGVVFSAAGRKFPLDLEEMFFNGAPGVISRHLYWEEGLANASEALRRNLKKEGFLNVRLSEPKASFNSSRTGVTLFFDFDGGIRTYLGAVSISGNTVFTKDELRNDYLFELGEPFNEALVEQSQQQILTRYVNAGYLDVRFDDQNRVQISGDRKLAVLQLNIIEGPQYRFGTITITGAKRTKLKVVSREIEFSEGTPFSPEKMARAEERIASLGLFGRVQLVDTARKTEPLVKDVEVQLSETKPGLGEVGAAAIYEEPRLRAKLFSGVQYRNLSGLNQAASVRGEVSIPFSTQQQFLPFLEYGAVAGYRAPYPWEIPVNFLGQASLDRFETNPDTQTIVNRARLEGRIEKTVGRTITATYRILRLERSTTEQLRPLAGTSGLPVTASIGSTGPGLILDFRDNAFNPSRGSYHSFDIELAMPFLFSQAEIGFVSGIMKNSVYIPLMDPFRLTLFLGAGYATSLLAGRGIPDVRLVNELALGGQGSIRGHAPQALAAPRGTSQLAFYNARGEVAWSLFGDFSLATFFDTGQLFPELQSTEPAHGVGLGVRYRTPVGPVVLDFAQGLGNFGQSSQRSIRFYFTVGTL